MWFKNLKIYRLSSPWTLVGEQLEETLARHAYQASGSAGANNLEMQSLGWVPPRENGGLAHVVGGQILLTLRAEKKLLPGTVVNQVAKARAQEIEEQQGYKPGRKQMKEIKERVTDELLPRAFSVYRDTRVWIDPQNHWLVIDAAASAKADEVIGLLAKCIDPFPLENLYVAQSPASAMTGWLAEDEAPSNFTIDQDTELRSSGESGAAIRYVKHSIDADDVRRHIQSGKQCTRLAMTWADRISFVLTENLDVKRVAPLDVLKEGNEAIAANDDEKFDSDMMLMTGELAADGRAGRGAGRRKARLSAASRTARDDRSLNAKPRKLDSDPAFRGSALCDPTSGARRNSVAAKVWAHGGGAAAPAAQAATAWSRPACLARYSALSARSIR